jgi:hypothetical protein
MQWVMSSDDGQGFRGRSWTNFYLAALTVAISSLAMACSDPVKPTGTGGQGGESVSSSSTGGTGGMGGSAGGSTTGGSGGAGGVVEEMPGPVEEVMKFDPLMGELGEGIAIDGTTAYISFGSTKVITVDLEKKTRADYGNVAAPIGIGTPQGIALDSQKNVYVAVSSVDPVQFKPGIYKFPAGGGTATLHAEHMNMTYPRHLLFHPTGTMIVSAAPSARIFAFLTDGTVNVVGPTQVLSGDQMSACAWGDGIAYGVSSLAFSGTTVFGANADRAFIMQGLFTGATFDLNPMPLAGPDCATLGGAESIVIDPYDLGTTGSEITVHAAARKVNKITRVRHPGGAVKVIADGTNLYEPSAMALAVVGTDRYLYIVNSARTTFATTGIPGLVRIRLGKGN